MITLKSFDRMSTSARILLVVALISVLGAGYVAYRAITNGPNDAQAIGDLIAKGDIDAAIEQGERLLARGSTDVDVMTALATAYIQKGLDTNDITEWTGKAIDVMNRSISLHSGHSESYRILAHAYVLRKDFKSAEEQLKTAIGLNERNVAALSLYGQVYEYRRDMVSAAKYYNQALQFDAFSDDAELGLARIAMYADNLAEAKVRAERVEARAEAARVKTQAQEMLGIIASRTNNVMVAYSYFKEVLAATPSSVTSLVGYGDILLRIIVNAPSVVEDASFENALSHARMALAIDPANVYAHALAARAYGFMGNEELAKSFASSTLALARGSYLLSDEERKNFEGRFSENIKVTVQSIWVTNGTTTYEVTPQN